MNAAAVVVSPHQTNVTSVSSPQPVNLTTSPQQHTSTSTPTAPQPRWGRSTPLRAWIVVTFLLLSFCTMYFMHGFSHEPKHVPDNPHKVYLHEPPPQIHQSPHVVEGGDTHITPPPSQNTPVSQSGEQKASPPKDDDLSSVLLKNESQRIEASNKTDTMVGEVQQQQQHEQRQQSTIGEGSPTGTSPQTNHAGGTQPQPEAPHAEKKEVPRGTRGDEQVENPTKGGAVEVRDWGVDEFAKRSNAVPVFEPNAEKRCQFMSEYAKDRVDFAIYNWRCQGIDFTFALDRVALERAVQPVKDSHGIIILSFSDTKYLDLLVNWLIGLDRVGIDLSNVLIVALDEPTQVWLREHNIASFLIPLCHKYALWYLRSVLFRNLAEIGVSFVHSDTDAIWTRNPMQRFFYGTEHTMMASQGTLAPSRMHQLWGFVMCAGFFFCQPTQFARDHLRAMLWHLFNNPVVPIHATDQDSLNIAFHELGVQWHVWPNTTYAKRQFTAVFWASTEPVVGTFDNYDDTVALMPHHLITRKLMFNKIEDPYVLHLYSHAYAESKDQVFSARGLWMYRKDWRVVPYQGNLTEWLHGCRKEVIELKYYRKDRDHHKEHT